MKGKLVGWLVSGLFVAVVVAVIVRVPAVRRIVFGEQAAAA